MRGRLPTPTAIKAIRGFPGHHPLNEDEPEIEVAAPAMPAPPHLSEVARAKWNALLPHLVTARVLTIADLDTLAAFCMFAADVEKFAALASEYDDVPDLSIRYRRVLRQSHEGMLKCGDRLGLNPAARSRVKTDGASSPQSRAEAANAIRERLRRAV